MFKKFVIWFLKLFSFIPAIAMMAMIYHFSAQPGAVSGRLSYEISYDIVEIKNELLDSGYTPDELAVQARGIHYYVRKAAHVTEYLILAVAVSFPLYVYGVRGIWLLILAGLICVGYAGFDEHHQARVAGRGPSVRDVGIDSMGVFAGILVVQAFCWTVSHNPASRRKQRRENL